MNNNKETLNFKICYDAIGWYVCDGEHTILNCCKSGSEGNIVKDEVLQFTDKKIYPEGKAFEFKYQNGNWIVTDIVRELNNGTYEIERQWLNCSGKDREAVFVFEAAAFYQASFYMIPCVSYNGNKWGNGNEPKGYRHNGEPWVFSYSRTGLPAATFSQNDKYCVGMFVSDSNKESLESACSIADNGSRTIHKILWPEQEGPVAYLGRDQYGPAVENSLCIKTGAAHKVKLFITVSCVEEKNFGWTKAYDLAADIFNKAIPNMMSAEKVWDFGIEYAKTYLLCAGSEFNAFEIGMLPDGKHIRGDRGMIWKHRDDTRYEIGWCGQNITLANALINDFLLHGNSDSLSKGVAVIDYWESQARLENGLFYTLLDDVLKNNKAVLLDTCNLGWGAWQMLMAYEYAKEVQFDKPKWMDMGIRLCDFFCENMLPDGTFGRLWNMEGKCVDDRGTIGSFILLPLIKAYGLTGNLKYLDCAIKAFDVYVASDLDNVSCTAGALDTECVDKETCWPLLKSAIDLYELTGLQKYLRAAINAGYYTLSWMFHYDVLCNEESDFAVNNFHTYGGTAVSTQHHHLDPWGALLSHDWIRLYRHTGDERWKIRGQATWMNSLQCISDGTLEFHGMVRPAGSQNEAYFQSNWCFEGYEKRGGMNDWLVSWPGAFRLLTLMREKDWGILETKA